MDRIEKNHPENTPSNTRSKKEPVPTPKNPDSNFQDTFNNVPEQSTATDPEKIRELQNSIREATTKTTWIDKKIDPNSINIHNLPIDFDALDELIETLAEITGKPLTENKNTNQTLPPNIQLALPTIASFIANKHNPDIPVLFPTQEEIRAAKPWLSNLEKVLRKLSPKWGDKFGVYIEKKSQQAITKANTYANNLIEQIKTIKYPKKQFITELTNLYNHLAEPKYETVLGFFEDHQEVTSIEQKIYNLLSDLANIKSGKNHEFYTKSQYPFLNIIIPMIKLPPTTSQIRVAGTEIMEGVYTFLRQQKLPQQIHTPQEFDQGDGTLSRELAETFSGEKLEKVKKYLPKILTLIYKALPTNGQELTDKIYEIAEGICILIAQGKSVEEIVEYLLPN
jgi:hypothetical protein